MARQTSLDVTQIRNFHFCGLRFHRARTDTKLQHTYILQSTTKICITEFLHFLFFFIRKQCIFTFFDIGTFAALWIPKLSLFDNAIAIIYNIYMPSSNSWRPWNQKRFLIQLFLRWGSENNSNRRHFTSNNLKTNHSCQGFKGKEVDIEVKESFSQ